MTSDNRPAERGTLANVGTDTTTRVLYVPDEVVVGTWRALRPTADAGAEGVVLWAAPAPLYLGQIQVVTTVIVPRQRVSAGRYELPPDAVREMGRTLRARGLVNVAQLHTHPTDWVDHSPWDDTHAFSLREGAISVVWPWYGRHLPPTAEWGVHERRGADWVRLGSGEAAARVRVLASVVDLRAGLEWLDEAEVEDAADWPEGGAAPRHGDSPVVQRGTTPQSDGQPMRPVTALDALWRALRRGGADG